MAFAQDSTTAFSSPSDSRNILAEPSRWTLTDCYTLNSFFRLDIDLYTYTTSTSKRDLPVFRLQDVALRRCKYRVILEEEGEAGAEMMLDLAQLTRFSKTPAQTAHTSAGAAPPAAFHRCARRRRKRERYSSRRSPQRSSRYRSPTGAPWERALRLWRVDHHSLGAALLAGMMRGRQGAVTPDPDDIGISASPNRPIMTASMLSHVLHNHKPYV
ncbi:hypothetical protein R3P38DRAFT_3596399 [Favolaschia claudopus]|uniref:Uncharacterized protein n=1 Tax=Favolaschia claudopus TaxID=2862362 RepID=A0AAW0AE06_9AGAR